MPRKQTNRHCVSRADVPADYPSLLANIKQRIRTAQVRATFSANAELIRLYWDIGRAIAQRQQRQGWGSAVIPRLACDLRNELPEVKGFSERNIDRMGCRGTDPVFLNWDIRRATAPPLRDGGSTRNARHGNGA